VLAQRAIDRIWILVERVVETLEVEGRGRGGVVMHGALCRRTYRGHLRIALAGET